MNMTAPGTSETCGDSQFRSAYEARAVARLMPPKDRVHLRHWLIAGGHFKPLPEWYSLPLELYS